MGAVMLELCFEGELGAVMGEVVASCWALDVHPGRSGHVGSVLVGVLGGSCRQVRRHFSCCDAGRGVM